MDINLDTDNNNGSSSFRIGKHAYRGDSATSLLTLDDNGNLWVRGRFDAGGGGATSPWGRNGSSIYYDRGNVGIGHLGIANSPVERLHVAGSTRYSGTTVLRSSDRPTMWVTGQYPNMIVASRGNASHSSTIGMWAWDGGGTTRQWNMGVGQNGVFSIGYCTNNQNPHCGLNNYVTTSAMYFDTDRNVGIKGDPGNYAFAVRDAGRNVYFDVNNLLVHAPEAFGGDVRLGAVWNKPGIYVNPDLYLSSESRIIINDNNQENWYFDSNRLYSNNGGRITLDNSVVGNTTAGIYWNGTDDNYAIHRESGGWIRPLRIGFHTGIKIGAHVAYSGVRFYNDQDMNTEIFSVGRGDNNVRVNYALYSPIMYDSNNAGYWVNPASGHSANFAGYIHATVYYDENNTGFYADPASTSYFNDMRANIYYDRNNTAYYADPASTSYFNDFRMNIIYDRQNTHYRVDPNGHTRLSRLDADIFYDRNNTAYYADPASTSYFNDFRMNIIYDRQNTHYRVDPNGHTRLSRLDADIFYDRNNTGYYANPASLSRFDGLHVNYLKLSDWGGACNAGNAGIIRYHGGNVELCHSNRWSPVGGGGGGVRISADDEGYGCHGACEGWNNCGNARTCANWACQLKGHGQNAVHHWNEARAGSCRNLRICHLFYYSCCRIQMNWGNWCGVYGAPGIHCN